MLNKEDILDRKSMIYSILILIFFLSVGIYISFQNFLFFQVIANSFAMAIGISMAVIALNTYEISQIQYFTYLGLAYGFVALFDALHILTHAQLALFTYPMNISIKLWIVARVIQSVSLFVSFLNLNYKFKINLFFIVYSSISLFSIYIIFNTDIFNPSTFSIMLFTIILIILSIITMFKYKKYFNRDIYYLLMLSMIMLLISNSFFINFFGQRNTPNALGYIFKILSFYLLYKAVNCINLKEPYKTLFYKLNKNNKMLEQKTIELKLANKKLTILSLKDSLTGLYNRAYFEEEIRLMKKLGYETLAIIMADLDDMKLVNDNMGHLMGDKYLKEAADILKSSLRDDDTVARIGGDEFAIILYDIEKEDVKNLISRIKDSVKKYNENHDEFIMSISIGWDLIKNGEKTIEKALKAADERMYKEKIKNKKNKFRYLKVKN